MAFLVAIGTVASLLVKGTVPSDEAVSLVPPHALSYATLFLDPSREQRDHLDELLGQLPRIQTLEGARSMLVDLLDPELAKVGLTFDRDIEPWLGRQVGLFLLPPDGSDEPEDGAALIATRDETASRRAFANALEHAGDSTRARTYRGVSYEVPGTGDDAAFAIVEGFVVVGTEPAVEAVIDASLDASLATDRDYQRVAGAVPNDVLAKFYLDVDTLFAALVASGDASESDLDNATLFGITREPVLATVQAIPGGAAMDLAQHFPEGAPWRSLVEFDDDEFFRELPADTSVALGWPEVGRTVPTLVRGLPREFHADEAFREGAAQIRAATGIEIASEVLPWMGDAAFFLQGSWPSDLPRGGLLVDSLDPAATAAIVDDVRAYASGRGVPTTTADTGGLRGFTVSPPGGPSLNLLGGTKLVFGVGSEPSVLVGGRRLGDVATFQAADDALGEGSAFMVYLDGPHLARAIDEFVTARSGDDAAYGQGLARGFAELEYVAAGVRVVGDVVARRIVAGG